MWIKGWSKKQRIKNKKQRSRQVLYKLSKLLKSLVIKVQILWPSPSKISLTVNLRMLQLSMVKVKETNINSGNEMKKSPTLRLSMSSILMLNLYSRFLFLTNSSVTQKISSATQRKILSSLPTFKILHLSTRFHLMKMKFLKATISEEMWHLTKITNFTTLKFLWILFILTKLIDPIALRHI